MSDAPYSCYYEVASGTSVVSSEFFQCFNDFTQKYEDYLCVLHTSSISIYRVRKSDDDADLEYEETTLELRYHQRVFGHMQAVKRYRRNNSKRSDVLLLAMDSGKLVLAEFKLYEDTIAETIVCNMELGNNNPSLDGKQYYLGHGAKPVLVVSEEYHAIALSVYGEQIFSCSLLEDAEGNIVVGKKLITHLQSDLMLTGPIMDICFVGGYGNPTCAVLQQDHMLTIGHAAKVLNTSSVSVLGFNYDSGFAALLWRAPALPHDSLRLIPFRTNSLPGAIMVITHNAIVVAHQDSISALPTNGFAATTVGTNTSIRLKPWKASDKGLLLGGSQWLQYGPSSPNEGSFMGFLRDGTLVLLHLSYFTPRQANTLDMELVVFRENVFVSSCCASRHQPELLFTASRNGTNALYRIGYNEFVRQLEHDRNRALYMHSFLETSELASVIVDLDEDDRLYGPHGMDVDKANSSQWVIDLRLLDTFANSGPILHGMVVKPDETLSQVDHVRWNRTANLTLASYSSAASYIPDRESKEALLLSCGRDKDASLNRLFSGIAYSKSATKSFPGGKTMYSVNLFGKSVILLAFANKTRIFQCDRVAVHGTGPSRPDTSVKFHEWSGEDSGFIVHAKTLFVGVVAQTAREAVVVQVTPTSIRLLKVSSSFDSQPLQDMSLHETVDIGGLGGKKDEVFITADASTVDGHIVLLSSHLNAYFTRYHVQEENMELMCIHRSPDDRRSGHHASLDQLSAGSGDLSVIDSAIVSISLFVGGLHLLDYNWRDLIRSPTSQRVYTELELEELALYGELLSTERDEDTASSVPTTTSSATAAAVGAGVTSLSLAEPPAAVSRPHTSLPLPKIDGPTNAIVYAIITEKNGTLSIFRLDDMKCIVRTPLVSLQTDHVPLSLWNTHVPPTTPGGGASTKNTGGPKRSSSTASGNGQNDESFIVETKMFVYHDGTDDTTATTSSTMSSSTPSAAAAGAAATATSTTAPAVFLAVLFSSGELVLYRIEDICGVHIAMNRLLTHTVHARRYPGVPFIRGINNSEGHEIPNIFMASKDAEYICRMPPTISVMQHSKGAGTKVFIAGHETKQLCFDRTFPVLLSLDFPETPVVNFGICTALPLFIDDASILATLWYEYEDLDTSTENTKAHRIKNKPLKQSTFGVYRQLPRQRVRAGMHGTMQALAVEKTVHKCLEINRLTDNRTEQALLDKRTYLLLCSQDVYRPFNPHVITEADGDTENVEFERYFPNVDSFQQPNADLAPLPLMKAREYRVCLMQNGKIIDNFQINDNEKVLDATVLYLTVEKAGKLPPNAPSSMTPPKTYEKRVFVLVSTLFLDKRGEDTQGNGRMLLLSLDYAMFEGEAGENGATKASTEANGNGGNGSGSGGGMDVDENVAAAGGSSSSATATANAAPSSSSANGSNGGANHTNGDKANGNSKQSLAQQQFLGSIQAKLRQVWVGPGPASVVHQMPSFPYTLPGDAPPGPWSNYVLATVGPILYVYKFNSETMELSQVAFYFASVTSMPPLCSLLSVLTSVSVAWWFV